MLCCLLPYAVADAWIVIIVTLKGSCQFQWDTLYHQNEYVLPMNRKNVHLFLMHDYQYHSMWYNMWPIEG